MRSKLITCLILFLCLHARADVIDTVAGSGKSQLDAGTGSARDVNIAQPFGVEIVEDGEARSLYVCEVGNHRVFHIDLATGNTRVIAGTGQKGDSGDGGPATKALMDEPYEVRVDARGDIYVVEMKGARVRKIDGKTGLITTIAGTGEPGYGGDDGPATKAKLRRPHSIALDGHGGLYIADIGNHRIRRVDLKTGRITTVAGTGRKQLPVDGSVATGRPMLGPRALYIVGDTMWIALREGHSVWRMDLRTHRLKHVAGTGKKGHRDASAKLSSFNGPKGIVANRDGSRVWVVDTENQCIREIDVKKDRVRTVAGYGPQGVGFGGDGGPATKAKMGRPHGITVDRRGVLYIGDTNNHRVRRVRPSEHSEIRESVESVESTSVAPWSQFLGPRRDGVSRETGLNLRWSKRKPKVLWRRPLGKGFSSISCDGERVFTMASQKRREFAVAFDAASGKVRWVTQLGAVFRDSQNQGEGPRATPTVHDGKLYCLLAAGDLFCLDVADGSEIWKINVFEASGSSNHHGEGLFWGLAGSPIVEGGRVIVQPGGKGSSVAAFDVRSGKLAWKTGSDPVGYGSPIVIEAGGMRQLIATTGSSFVSLDPRTGRSLWRHEWKNSFHCNCATPQSADGLLFVSSSYGSGCAALELGFENGKPTATRRWKNGELQNHYSTSIILDGHVYGCHANQGSTLRCLELATGKLRWVSRGAGKCSMIAVEGHLICLSERGVLTLVRADPRGFVPRGQVKGILRSKKAWAPPALSGGRLYVRDDREIVCLDLRPRS
jgi:outer membrane protein assembly factor BamB